MSVCISTNGTKLAAVVSGGYIYTSSDSGATWTARTAAGSRSWRRISGTYLGDKLAAVVTSGYVYTSSDSGATWKERTVASARDWVGITISSDGTKLVAAGYGTYIFFSTDSGSTWTIVTATGPKNWNVVAASQLGDKLICGVNDATGEIYQSLDYGATWNKLFTAVPWNFVSSSSDGRKLAGCSSGNYIYTSP